VDLCTAKLLDAVIDTDTGIQWLDSKDTVRYRGGDSQKYTPGEGLVQEATEDASLILPAGAGRGEVGVGMLVREATEDASLIPGGGALVREATEDASLILPAGAGRGRATEAPLPLARHRRERRRRQAPQSGSGSGSEG